MHEIVAVSARTRELTGQIIQIVSWPADARLLVYPETILDRQAGATIWKGHRAQNSTFAGLWANAFEWDYAVLVDEALGEQLQYPALFTWVLSHELGHAIAGLRCEELLGLHIFVQENMRTASAGHITEWAQIPFELAYDRFGLAMALELFARDTLLTEAAEALEQPHFVIHRARLERLQALEPLPNLPDMLNDLRAFVCPYKYELRRLWEAQAQREQDQFICAGIDPGILFD